MIRKETLLAHELDGELVLYDPDRDVVHTFNATAHAIWKRCDGAHGIEDIVRELTARYAVSPEAAREDVERVLAQLRTLQLIRQVEPK